VTVVDGWQRRGVGRELVLALRERGLRAGVRRISATVVWGGAPALLRVLGPCRMVSAESGAIELRGSWV